PLVRGAADRRERELLGAEAKKEGGEAGRGAALRPQPRGLEALAVLQAENGTSFRHDREHRVFRSDNVPIEWEKPGSAAAAAELRRFSRADLARYLAARQGDVDRAFRLAEGVAAWRASVRPDLVSFPQIETAISQVVWRYVGWSKCGYPLIACDASKWAPSKYKSVDEYIRYISYMVELLVEFRSSSSSEMVRPIAMQCLLQLSRLVQEVNAERLAAYFLNCSLAFRFSWHFLAPLMDPRTRRKIHWPNPPDNRAILGQFVDLSVLEERFGGDFVGLPVVLWPPAEGFGSSASLLSAPPAYNSQMCRRSAPLGSLLRRPGGSPPLLQIAEDIFFWRALGSRCQASGPLVASAPVPGATAWRRLPEPQRQALELLGWHEDTWEG
ncbi:unnamed protein product, partial [Polarella glacialis]